MPPAADPSFPLHRHRRKINERLDDPSSRDWYEGLFPKDTANNLRFAINFFTSIGLGGETS